MNKYTLCTKRIDPPISTRKFDWTAWLDGHEERGCGLGETEQEALLSLAGMLWE